VEVLSPNVIWAQDATHLGRVGCAAVQAEVIKDRATLGYPAVTVGPVAKAQEILWILQVAKQQKSLPLVWATDNGAAYRDERVKDYLKREKVVHLLSRPRLPQDNGGAEKGIRELKECAELGKGTKLNCLHEPAQKLAHSLNVLTHHRLRGSKGYRTSQELEVQLPAWHEKVERGVFYEHACRSREKAVKGGGTKREVRQAERQAVYETLEQFQLITRTRGGKPLKLVPKRSEDIL
jgi:transposase InsO family protein